MLGRVGNEFAEEISSGSRYHLGYDFGLGFKVGLAFRRSGSTVKCFKTRPFGFGCANFRSNEWFGSGGRAGDSSSRSVFVQESGDDGIELLKVVGEITGR